MQIAVPVNKVEIAAQGSAVNDVGGVKAIGAEDAMVFCRISVLNPHLLHKKKVGRFRPGLKKYSFTIVVHRVSE